MTRLTARQIAILIAVVLGFVALSVLVFAFGMWNPTTPSVSP